jgi:hypothetical protein
LGLFNIAAFAGPPSPLHDFVATPGVCANTETIPVLTTYFQIYKPSEIYIIEPAASLTTAKGKPRLTEVREAEVPAVEVVPVPMKVVIIPSGAIFLIR